jgi:hypothetical protein
VRDHPWTGAVVVAVAFAVAAAGFALSGYVGGPAPRPAAPARGAAAPGVLELRLDPASGALRLWTAEGWAPVVLDHRGVLSPVPGAPRGRVYLRGVPPAEPAAGMVR